MSDRVLEHHATADRPTVQVVSEPVSETAEQVVRDHASRFGFCPGVVEAVVKQATTSEDLRAYVELLVGADHS